MADYSPYLQLQTGTYRPPKAYSPYPAMLGATPRNRSTNQPTRRPSSSYKFGQKTQRTKSLGFGPKSQQPQRDLLGELYNSLISQLQEDVSVDEDDLMAQIRAAYDPVYNARRSAIEEMMRSAQQRSATGRQEVVNQYESLGKDYERLAPEATAQAEQFRAGTEELYGKLRSNIEGNYSRIQQEQKELFEELGIEAAAPEVLEPQGKAAAEATTDAETLGTLAQQREREVGQLESRYWREGAPLARLQGSNMSAEMLAGLEDYLRSRETDITQLEAERSSGIQGAYTQLLQQAQQNAQSQERWQTEMLFNVLNQQMEARNQPQEELTPESYLSMLGPQAGNVLDAYRQIERSPEAVVGKQFIGETLPDYPVPGEVAPITDQWWLAQVDEMLEAGMIDETTAQLLMNYIRLTQK